MHQIRGESNRSVNQGFFQKNSFFQKNVVFVPRTETAQRMNAMENASKNAGEPLWQNCFGQPVNHIALVTYILYLLVPERNSSRVYPDILASFFGINYGSRKGEVFVGGFGGVPYEARVP